MLYVQHTTAGLTVNENADPTYPRHAARAPHTNPSHTGWVFAWEENSDAHIKASLLGPSVTVLSKTASLLLGRWQGTFSASSTVGASAKVIMMIK